MLKPKRCPICRDRLYDRIIAPEPYTPYKISYEPSSTKNNSFYQKKIDDSYTIKNEKENREKGTYKQVKDHSRAPESI